MLRTIAHGIAEFGCICHRDVFIHTKSCDNNYTHRLKELTVLDKVAEVLITKALQSLEQIKKLGHPYSKALAQVRVLLSLLAFVRSSASSSPHIYCVKKCFEFEISRQKTQLQRFLLQ